MSGSNQTLSRPGGLPVWPSASPLNPDGLVTYQHPAGEGHELYQLPVSRLLGGKTGTPTSGTAQVETAGVTAASGFTKAGVFPITITSAIFGGDYTVDMSAATADNTATKVATAMAVALNADAVVSAHFVVTSSTSNVILTARKAAANDTTLNVSWLGVSGVTARTTSTNTTAGVLGTPSEYVGQSTTATDGSIYVCTDVNLNTWVQRPSKPRTAAPTSGTAQVETATASGTASGDGNVAVTVVTALLASPVVTQVAISENDTAATWADKVRTALGNVTAITDLFTVGGSSTTIVLTAKSSAANDTTLNIALANGAASPGITPAASSANTTAGVLGTVPLYLGEISVVSGTVKIATSLLLNTWGTVSIS